jgi:hypothetical protein
MRRLPVSWRPRLVWKKLAGRPHWRIGSTHLLSHPGCLLSHQRPLDTILPAIKRAVQQQKITVLVTHWWEYFNDGVPYDAFIRVLHQTADLLASDPSLVVLPFRALTDARHVPDSAAAALPAAVTG